MMVIVGIGIIMVKDGLNNAKMHFIRYYINDKFVFIQTLIFI